MALLPADLPVLILTGDQDPVAGFGEGAYRVANGLWDAGLRDIRTPAIPCAMTRRGSVTAAPMRTEPTSRARTRPFGRVSSRGPFIAA